VQVLGRYPAYDRLDAPGSYPDQDKVEAFRVALQPGEIPALGIIRLSVRSTRRAPRPIAPVDAVRAVPGGLRASWARVRVPRGGGFGLESGEANHAPLLRIESERDEGDTYTFEPVGGDRPLRAAWSRSASTVWRGPLIAAIERRWNIRGRAHGTVSARLDAGSRLLRLVITGVNTGRDHRLRLVFPLGAGDGTSVAGMQFGAVSRVHERHRPEDFPGEWPVATAPLHRWVSAPGLTLLVRGAFEYERTQQGELALTVLRAVGELSRGSLRARPGHAAWPQPAPAAQEPGAFRVELGVTLRWVTEQSSPDAWSELDRLAEEFHGAPAGLMLRYGLDVPAGLAGPALSGDGLSFSALTPRERGSGVVARCVNLTDSPQDGIWTWPRPVRRAFLARLDETPVRRLPVSRGGRQVRFTAAARATVTVVVEP
jgi:alpha-mannosidase